MIPGILDGSGRMEREIEAHMPKQDSRLFPRRGNGGQGLAMAMDLMGDEHDDHRLTRGHEPPEDARGTRRAREAGSEKSADNPREHIRPKGA